MSPTKPEKKEEETDSEVKVATVPRRFNRRAGDASQQTTSTWLISFTDVMALMLTFFVLLFSMSNPQAEDWARLKKNMQENFKNFQGKPLNRSTEDAININKVNFSRALDLGYLKAIINNLIEQEPSLQVARIIDNGNSLIVALPGDLLFDSGQAEIKTQTDKALFTLAGTLGRIKNRIEVVGHTDPRPLSGGAYESNWGLSLARATNVAAVLENVGYERPIVVRGQASGRYADLPPNLSTREKRDLSRRVDIVIMEDDGKRLKLFDIGLPSAF